MNEINQNQSVEAMQTVDAHKSKFNWKRSLITATFVIIAAGAVGGVTWYLMDQNTRDLKIANDKSVEALESTINDLKAKLENQSKETNVTSETASATTSQGGTIEGSIGYPSSGVPTTISVYAIPVNGGKTYSTSTQIKNSKYRYGVGYNLVVPTGQYYVYGMNPGFNDDSGETYKAYYDKYVTCGLSVDCKDYSKIVVSVTSGKTTSNIDIFDWYPTK